MNDIIYLESYGDMLSQINGYELVSMEYDGGYQGNYCVVLSDGERLFYYIDSYGSCSGCDWLESENIAGENKINIPLGKNYAIKYKDALEFCGGIKPRFITPKEIKLKIINKGKYEGFEIKYEN